VSHDDMVLMSVDEYKRLRQLDQQAFYAHELPREVIDALGTVPIPREAQQFDDECEPT